MHQDPAPCVARRARAGRGSARALHCAALGLLALLSAAPLAAQQVRRAPPSLLAKFDVAAGTLQTLALSAARQDALQAQVVLGGTAYTMAIALHDVRAPGFELIEQSATGQVLVQRPACVTYRGALRELPGSRVAASVVDGMLDGLIYLPPAAPGQRGETWAVQAAHKVDPRAAPSLHVVFREQDTTPLPVACAVSAVASPQAPAAAPDYTAVCEVAIEADREFWQLNGNNVTQTQNDITAVMNQVDFIYFRDCDVSFSIVTILVTTGNVYSSNDPQVLLSQFASRWSTVHSGVARDVAHLFTGRNLSGLIGVAYQAGVCSPSNGYGLSQSRFTSNVSARVGLTCHELGHNLGASHCDGSPSCYIMCSGLGNCGGLVTLFGPTAAAQIDAFAHAAACMPPPTTPPTLAAVTPGSAPVFSPGSVTLSGAGLSTVTSYSVGGQTSQTGFQVISNTAVSIELPEGTALGPTPITVTDPLGTSNAVSLDYVVTQPVAMRATDVIPATGGVASYDFGGTPGNAYFLVLNFTTAMAPVQGFNLLANPLVLSFGTFSAPLGIENVSVPVPPGLGILQFFFQVLESTPQGQVSGVSNLTTTVLL